MVVLVEKVELHLVKVVQVETAEELVETVESYLYLQEIL